MKWISMRLCRRVSFMLLVAILPLLISGCASITPEEMVPTLGMQPGTHIDASVEAEVTGGKSSHFGGADYVDNDQFKKALNLTLTKSHVFKAVRSDHADLKLHAHILNEDQTGFLPFTATMLVTYKLTTSDGKNVWSQPFVYTKSRSWAFSGATRGVEAREGCVRKNLAVLIQAIRKNATDIQSQKTGRAKQ